MGSPAGSGTGYGRWAARWRVPLHFLMAAVLLGFARPTATLLVVGAVVAAVGLAVRAWSAGHLRREQVLTTSGPYAYVRHPLYLGSAIVLAGFALAGGRVELAVLFALYFPLLFFPVMRREEGERRERAPDVYPAYAARVPAFLPYRSAYRGDPRRFDWQAFGANREWRAEVGCALLLVLLYAKMVWG